MRFIAFRLTRIFEDLEFDINVNTTKTNIFKLRIGGLGGCFSKPIFQVQDVSFREGVSAVSGQPPRKKKQKTSSSPGFKLHFLGELARIDSNLNQTSLAKLFFP